jgi:hypothetical protein
MTSPSTEELPPAVEAALERLAELEGKPVPEHVDVFDGVHRLLQDALATLDEA